MELNKEQIERNFEEVSCKFYQNEKFERRYFIIWRK